MLAYYNQELRHLRQMGREFALEFPKIAKRLDPDSFKNENLCPDPYVERLLEGFAFLAARVQLKIDAEFPEFAQHLLEFVYPHYLAPTPSMAVARLRPEDCPAAGFPIPRHTLLKSRLNAGEHTRCLYRTAHALTLWPLEIEQAQYFSSLAAIPDETVRAAVQAAQAAASHGAPVLPEAKAAIRLRLRTTGEQPPRFAQLALDTLPLFLSGQGDLTAALYEQLLADAVALAVAGQQDAQTGQPWAALLRQKPRRAGFADEQALLPYGPRSFQGYRLLQEYFALPHRFLFVEFAELRRAVKRCDGQELELIVLFDRHEPSLEGSVGAAQFLPFCTPAINLFPKRVDRIHLSERVNEHHVIADRTRPMDFEIHSLDGITGHGTGPEQPFLPFYAVRDPSRYGRDQAYYTVRREPRVLSSDQRRNGPRSTYVGSETFVSLVDSQQAPYRHDLRQLGVSALCTNRDLPLFMSVGNGKTDFTLADSAPVLAVRCVAGPSRPRASHAHDAKAWRLISQLSLNYLSLSEQGQGAGALRELLRLYGDSNDAALQLQIEGLREVSSKAVTRRLPMPGPIVFGRGLEITLEFDENAFRGTGVFLLGAVLERFLARYVSINSFTETVIRTTERGEIMRWKAKPGRRPTL